jgi:hypothetical protein
MMRGDGNFFLSVVDTQQSVPSRSPGYASDARSKARQRMRAGDDWIEI